MELEDKNLTHKNICDILVSVTRKTYLFCNTNYIQKNVYILLFGGIISVGDTYMNNGKEKNKENTKEEYKVNYFFAEDSKININEILKNSFLLSLKAEEKNM